MRRPNFPALGITATLLAAAFSAHAASLQDAATALGVAKTQSIEFSGSGHWFQFGQAPNAKLPWPQFDLSRYVADIDYDKAAARVQITRQQSDDPKRRRPAPVTQWQDQHVIGRCWPRPIRTT